MMSWEKARYQGRKSEDVDVTKERLRVESNNDPVTSKRDEEKRDDVVIIKHLTKFYNWKKVIIIHDTVLFRSLFCMDSHCLRPNMQNTSYRPL